MNLIYEQIVRQIQSALLVTDSKLRILYINEVAWQTFMASPAARVGRSVRRAFSPSVVRVLTEAWQQVQKTQAAWRVDEFKWVSRTPEKTEKIIGFTASPWRSEHSGTIEGMIISAKDITHLIAMQEQIKHSQKLGIISQLVLTLHHEIRNPLTAISTAVQMINSHRVSDAAKMEALCKIIEEKAIAIENVMQKLNQITEPVIEMYPGGVPFIDLKRSK
ncbi:MAG: PAS domain-containing protein [Candidatus Margulisiibacteriota bacterium]